VNLWDAIRWLFRRSRRQRLRMSTAPALLLAPPRARPALALPPVICLPDLTERPKPKNWSAASTAALSGQFYFRDTILDQLDEYFVYAKRMKRADLDAYALYSKIGAIILPVSKHLKYPDEMGKPISAEELSPWFRQTLPGFGAVAQSMSSRIEQIEDDKRILYPRFTWFTKYERQSPKVQWTNIGVSYSCCVYWDKRLFKGERGKLDYGAPQEFPVVILPDGSVQVLRVLINDRQIIHHKQGSHRGYTSRIPQQRWGIFKDFIDWARDHHQDPQQFLSRIFINAANSFQEANSSMIRIAARKDGVTATFGIDPARTPYFFADRDETVTENGVKQRIFHMVRTHVRRNGSGVKMHFRGARRFRWKGYDVQIMVPVREHIDPAEMNIGVYDEYWRDELKGAIYAANFGDAFGNAMQAPPGDWTAQRAAIMAMGRGTP
jgi:hypothetical protein